MPARRDMLRSFIGAQYGAAPLNSDSEVLKAEMFDNPSPDTLLRATTVPLLLPHLVDAIEQIIIHPEAPDRVRAYAGGLLTYVYNPLDLFQHEELVGWIDDAVVCALGLQKLADAEAIEVDSFTASVCRTCCDVLPEMKADLREGIKQFVEQMWNSHAVVGD